MHPVEMLEVPALAQVPQLALPLAALPLAALPLAALP
jgi:hypothetical protein